MFFKSSSNKHCDYAYLYFSNNHIDFVQEVKYLDVLLNSSMKTSIDVSRQTRKFYAQANKYATAYATFVIVVGK